MILMEFNTYFTLCEQNDLLMMLQTTCKPIVQKKSQWILIFVKIPSQHLFNSNVLLTSSFCIFIANL